MKPWKTLAVAALAMLAAGTASAQAPEKKDIKLGVGGGNSLYYLPLALTEKLGFFREQGLNVEVNDFKGGSQSLTALIGGSVDIVTGAYEHTLRMQAKGQDIEAVIELGRYPGITLAVKKDRMDKIKTIADLKGAKIGVTAPGSSTNMIVQFLMGPWPPSRRARSTRSPTSIPSLPSSSRRATSSSWPTRAPRKAPTRCSAAPCLRPSPT
jgi:NitT/TauT family transport system substrate-binding protein